MTCASLRCRPRAEGRWAAIFERFAKDLGSSKLWQAEPQGKFAGFPAYQFRWAAKPGENQPQELSAYS